MKLDPRHLEILAAIVEHGGLSEGAEALNKSQSSVSRSLGLLQERVQIPLFEAGRRPLAPTDFCRALAAEGRKITEAGNSAAKRIRAAQMGQSGTVRVAGTPFFMDGVVSRMLARFQNEFPQIRIKQNYGYAGEILTGLESGVVDLGILPIRESEVPENLRFTRILRGQNVIACRMGHDLSKQASVRLSDIANYNWITPEVTSPLYQDLRSALESIGVKNFKISFSGGTLSSVINILSESDALTVLPYSVVFNMRRRNPLSALAIRIGDPDRHLCLLARKVSCKNRMLDRLESFIKGELQTLQTLMRRREQQTVWRR